MQTRDTVFAGNRKLTVISLNGLINCNVRTKHYGFVTLSSGYAIKVKYDDGHGELRVSSNDDGYPEAYKTREEAINNLGTIAYEFFKQDDYELWRINQEQKRVEQCG